MAEFSEEFLQRTIKFWQPRYPYPLTLEDAREIAENMTGLFQLLDKLGREDADEKKADV